MATVKYNLGTVGGMAVTELWSGTTGSLISAVSGVKIALNDEFTNYKFLVFDLCTGYDNGTLKRYYSKVISVQQIINLINNADANEHITFTWGFGSYNDCFEILQDSTTKVLNTNSQYTQCTRIVGLN